jgi:uracil-DNA glycosylase family 4
MDDRLKEEIAAWLEFFRELGIEDFYRREPGTLSKLEIRSSKLDNAQVVCGAKSEVQFQTPERQGEVPQPGFQNSQFTTHYSELVPEPKPRGPGTGGFGVGAPAAPIQILKSNMRNLSLFEAPPPVRDRETLDHVREDLGDCRRCKLAKGRKHIVFGQGHPHAELVFIGEGPGADEDEQGLPFVGRAGKLLNHMLELVGIKREDVYICNVVKCRPPGNRTPEKDEVDACSPFLFRQLDAIKPRLICCLGAPAARTVLGLKEGMLKIRGRFYDYGSAKAIATVHPAYVLRNPREEKILREDFEKIREFLKQPGA